MSEIVVADDDTVRAVRARVPAGSAGSDILAHPGRVLGWSGVGGWRSSPPSLVPRRAARTSGDDGFSMIELLVALLVMGILLAIAIPTFLGTTNAADDRSAQANLNTALTDAKAQYESGGQTYDVHGASDAAAFAGILDGAQLSLTFHTGNSGNLSTISVSVSAGGDGLVLAAYSVPGDCYYVVDNAQAVQSTAAPYGGGGTAVTTSAVTAPAGPITFPTAAGTSYVDVRGDTTKTDCNASRPKTGGSPATVQYSTSGFPH